MIDIGSGLGGWCCIWRASARMRVVGIELAPLPFL
jgi:hypothetical protein